MPGDTFQITTSGSSFVNVGDSHSYYSTSSDQKYDELLNSLLPNWQSIKNLGLSWDHDQAKRRHVGNTGKWLLDSDEFKSWLLKPGSFLWLHGIAGCGKTILRYEWVVEGMGGKGPETDLTSSTIIEYLRGPLTKSNYTAGYYFNANEDEKRNVSRLRRSLLLQLCPTEGDLPPKVDELHKKCHSHDFLDDDLLQGLKDLLEREGHTYVVIDALDECDASFRSGEESEIEKLAEFMLWLTSTKFSNLHILVTSRDGGLASIVDEALKNIIRNCTENNLYYDRVSLQARERKNKIVEDIGQFVDIELERWKNRKGRLWLPLSEDRQSLISNSVKGKANGMFRLAACLLDLIWRKARWAELESALNDLPPELPEVYDRIFNDIESQGQSEMASSLLRWLLFCERPLSLEELTEVTMADPQSVSFDTETGAKDSSYISLTLSSFVAISKEGLVQFAHQTVTDYLLLDTTQGGFFARKADSQAYVAKYCLSYMQFCARSDLKGRFAQSSRRRCPEEYMLLEYVFNNWYKHALRAWEDTPETHLPDQNKSASKAEMCQEEAAHSSTLPTAYLLVKKADKLGHENALQPFLEWAAAVKLWLDQMRCAERASYCDTLKAFACEGYEMCLELLSDTAALTTSRQDLDPEVLTAALVGRYDEMLQRILGREAWGDASDSSWWPERKNRKAKVSILTYKPHEAIMRFLLERGWDSNHRDYDGWTALHMTAFQGHDAIMKLLLEKGADISLKDYNGRTALHIAASQGHDVVTRLLLEKGADIGVRDEVGWTSLDLGIQKAALDFQPQWTQDDLDYHCGRMVLRVVQSNDETVARTIRLLSERRPSHQEGCDQGGRDQGDCDQEDCDQGDCDRATAELEFERPTRFVFSRFSRLTDVPIHEGAVKLIAPFVETLLLYGGFIDAGFSSLVEELLVHRHFATLSNVSLAGPLRQCRWPFNIPMTFRSVKIYGGTAKFATSSIGNVILYGGSATFSATTQIDQLVVNGGSAIFSGKTRINELELFAESATFSGTTRFNQLEVNGGSAIVRGTAQVDQLETYKGSAIFTGTALVNELKLFGGSATFSATTRVNQLISNGGSAIVRGTAQVDQLEIYEGSAIFTGTALVNELKLFGGSAIFSATAKVDQLEVYGGILHLAALEIDTLILHGGSTIVQSPPAKIKKMVVYGGTVNFVYVIYREMINLLLGEAVDIDGEKDRRSSMMRIQELTVNDGTVVFMTNGKIENVTIKGGEVAFFTGTALQLAVEFEHDAIVRLLLENGANPNARFRAEHGGLQLGDSRMVVSRETALHTAASQGREAIVQLLLENKADIRVKDDVGRTALQIAAAKGHMTIVRLFEEHELNVPGRDEIRWVGQAMLQKAIEMVYTTTVFLSGSSRSV